jgi:hypothetical protein
MGKIGDRKPRPEIVGELKVSKADRAGGLPSFFRGPDAPG